MLIAVNDPQGQVTHYIDNRNLAGSPHFRPDPAPPTYRDDDGYVYTYTPDQEFLITHDTDGTPYSADRYYDVVSGHVVERLTTVAQNAELRIYVDPNAVGGVDDWRNRYGYRNFRYVRAPWYRVRWVDAHGRWVEQLDDGGLRVLTDDGRRVRKYYAVTKDAQRHYVLPYKNQVGFMAGLPNLFGGNMDHTDADAAATVNREADEESNHQYVLGGGGMVHFLTVPAGGNEYSFSRATVVDGAGPGGASAEMAGTFRFLLSQLTLNQGATAANVRGELLAVFGALTGINTNNAFFTTQQVGQNGTPRAQFDASHSIAALVAEISREYDLYRQGWTAAEANAVDPGNADAEYVAGHTEYTQGWQRAQGGDQNDHLNWRAYTLGFTQYTQGWQRAQGNTTNDHATWRAYTLGYAEYNQGMQRAQTGALNDHATWHAYTLGYTEYDQGMQRAQATLGNDHPAWRAYTLGFTEYTQGRQRAQDGHDNDHPDRFAYTQGFNSYQPAPPLAEDDEPGHRDKRQKTGA